MKAQVNTIKQIAEQVLGHKIKQEPDPKDLLQVDSITTSDELALIKYYISNSHLINSQLIAELVSKQLKKFNIRSIANLPRAETWQAYLHKMEVLLEQVKYRKANNYEFAAVMPTKQQLMQLQQECWDFTEQWYGSGNGNLSCFYNYFIAMSQAAGVTRFAYTKIGKFISQDHYIALINRDQRRLAYEQHEKYNQDYERSGGIIPQGRSVIDATTTSNILYYKSAQLIFNLLYAKDLVVKALDLEDYGQLPYIQREQLWTLLQEHFPDNTEQDENSIFYRYVKFLNARPGEYFNYFAIELPEANNVEPRLFHDIVKVAGLQSGHLILLTRDVVDNWVAKRHFNLRWVRKYDLKQINDKHDIKTMRIVGDIEEIRLLPNEIPYAPGHGLSLCGDGLIDGIATHNSVAYEWNTPTDPKIDLDNWPRDIEKLFREFKFFCPAIQIKQQLLGEKPITMFHNSMAYSTIHTTQHTHLITLGIDKYLLYLLPTENAFYIPELASRLELVQVGSNNDAFYIRIIFDILENEPLIQFLLQLTDDMFKHFGGVKELDVYLQLFVNEEGKFVFIYEPHAFLLPFENDRFFNPHNNIDSARRPQFLQPLGDDISIIRGEMAGGLDYCRKFFDDTRKPGTHKFVMEYLQKLRQ